jgi:hypothetical protein
VDGAAKYSGMSTVVRHVSRGGSARTQGAVNGIANSAVNDLSIRLLPLVLSLMNKRISRDWVDAVLHHAVYRIAGNR